LGNDLVAEMSHATPHLDPLPLEGRGDGAHQRGEQTRAGATGSPLLKKEERGRVRS